MSKHTPGPWSCHHDEVDDFSSVEITPKTGPSRWVCDLNQPNHVANARLIAAAPELLSALRELLTLGQQESIEDGELEAAQRAAVAAIRKATGGAL